jgi:hypothetical protein
MNDEQDEIEPTPPIQFGLRSLLIWIAASSVLLAVLSRVSAVWACVVLWGLLLVAAHVFGNACGTKRQSRARRRATPSGCEQHPPLLADLAVTHLRTRRGLGWITVLTIGVGAIVGGVLGTLALAASYGPETMGYGGLSIGGASAGFVGGFLGFLTASFIAVASRAWNEATGGRRR